MDFNDTIGEPIPRGIAGMADSLRDGYTRQAEDARLAEIKAEVQQLRQSIGQLAESTTTYTRRRIENAAQTAVDRYPIGTMLGAALFGYWLAGRRR